MLVGMGIDNWVKMSPWVRRAVASSEQESLAARLDALVSSLARELAELYPQASFELVRRGESLLVSWAGEPQPILLADALNVDPTYDSSGAEVGALWGEDLPDDLRTVVVVLKHRG